MPNVWPTTKDGLSYDFSAIEDEKLRHELLDLRGRINGAMVLLRNPKMYAGVYLGYNPADNLSRDYTKLAISVIDDCKRLVELEYPISLNFRRVPAPVQQLMLEHARKIGLIGKMQLPNLPKKLLKQVKRTKVKRLKIR